MAVGLVVNGTFVLWLEPIPRIQNELLFQVFKGKTLSLTPIKMINDPMWRLLLRMRF